MQHLYGFVIFLIPFIFPEITNAHAFGQIYTLPIPTWVFIYAGALVVGVSFILASLFTSTKQNTRNKYQLPIKVDSLIGNSLLGLLGQFIGIALLVLLVISGLVGPNDALSNISPTLFWVIFYLGFTYLCIIFGNLWEVVNPFKTIILSIEKITKYEFTGFINYPNKWSYWPAFIFYLILLYQELLSGGVGSTPKGISTFLIIYTLLTISLVVIFGKNSWFKFGEIWSVFIGVISQVSIIKKVDNNFILQLPFTGVLANKVSSISLVFFIILMLSSTAFDGFRSTSTWFQLNFNLFNNLNFTPDIFNVVAIFALLISSLVFITVFIAACWMMIKLTKVKLSILEIVYLFAPTLIPIAVVYNIAHYFTLLIGQGQTIISFISDPFTQGWDIFGTAGFVVNPVLLRADTIWYTQVFIIVVGHIVAVLLAHIVALKTFKNSKLATISQVPMLLVMVIYTITGLWILSQPYQ